LEDSKKGEKRIKGERERIGREETKGKSRLFHHIC